MSRFVLIVLFLLGALAPPSAAAAKQFVRYETSAAPGTIVINPQRRKLYFVLGDGRAIAYPVGVPKPGWTWSGDASVSGKYKWPAWVPPAAVLKEDPHLPRYVRGGSPHNPMGARAMTLSEYEVAIHGSTRRMRRSIGHARSHGCIRMRNEDVIDLFRRVHVGTPVVMLP